jgi:hypothetical protein
MTKIVFGKREEVQYLDPVSGYLYVKGGASLKYDFGMTEGGIKYVDLTTTSANCFGKEGLDNLIAFLLAAREHIASKES